MRRDEATLRRIAEQGYGEAGERELRQREWASLRGERGEPAASPKAFALLVGRLRARKYWKAKDPANKARIVAYREQWRQDNRERHQASVNACKRRLRKNPAYRAAELAKKRAKHAEKSAARRVMTVYACHGPGCGAQWSPVPWGRLPTRPPKYCCQACRSRANYQRGKAQGKSWALRDKAHRQDRRAA